jgi:sulfoxide reductase heme-binding subunit YedZ
MPGKAHNPYLRAFGKTWMKPLTLLALCIPAMWLAVQVILALNNMPNALGFEPPKAIHHFLGETAIRTLLATLLVSPLRDITKWAPIALIRRRIGLAAFFYACAHLIAYLWLDKNWSIAAWGEDIVKRTYITFGMAALALMLPLALTSTNGMIRRLGRETWARIHWLIFPLAILAVVHHSLSKKAFTGEPVVHAIILALLLGWRIAMWTRGKLKKPEAAAA